VTSSFTQSWSDEVNEKVRTEALNASRRGFFSAIKDDKKIMADRARYSIGCWEKLPNKGEMGKI